MSALQQRAPLKVRNLKQQLEEIVGKGRGRPRDEEARSRILSSALEIVEAVGFSSVTTDAIAERAGASKATIYRWWPNKAAVLIEALRERVAQESPFPHTGDLRADINRQLQNFIGLLNSSRGRVLRAFLAGAQGDPEIMEAFVTVWVQPRRAEARNVLLAYQQDGSLRPDIDLDSVLDLLYGPIYFRLLIEHGSLDSEFGEQIADLALRGLQTAAVA